MSPRGNAVGAAPSLTAGTLPSPARRGGVPLKAPRFRFSVSKPILTNYYTHVTLSCVMPVRALTPQLVSDLGVFHAADMKAAPGGGSWHFEGLVGILAEISEEAPAGAVSFTAEIIAEAQERNEPVAWVAAADSIFFPPDLAERGVDLSALAVVRPGTGEADTLTATEWLVRSGSIGLVIVDVDRAGRPVTPRWAASRSLRNETRPQ